MSLLDKLAEVGDRVRDGIERRFGDDDVDEHELDELLGTSSAPAAPQVKSADQAYERLGLTPDSTLDEVRASYRALAQRWHPRAQQGGEAADRAQRELDGCLEALEVLEEHLLPLP